MVGAIAGYSVTTFAGKDACAEEGDSERHVWDLLRRDDLWCFSVVRHSSLGPGAAWNRF